MRPRNLAAFLICAACTLALVVAMVGLNQAQSSRIDALTTNKVQVAEDLVNLATVFARSQERMRSDLDVLYKAIEVLGAKDKLSEYETAELARRAGEMSDKYAKDQARLALLEFQPDFEAMVNATVRVFDINRRGFGSGVFIYDNVVLTAGHVVDMGDEFIVEYQGRDYKVLKTYRDPDSDLGMLLTEEIQEGHIAQMADAGELHLGQEVFAVGTPLGDRWYMNLTGGIISNTRRDMSIDSLWPNPDWSYLVGYDAFGGPGCSGGPVFTADGKLVLLCVMGETRDGSGLVMGQPVLELSK